MIAEQGLIQGDAECELIRTGIDAFARQLLWRHVARSAEHGTRGRQGRRDRIQPRPPGRVVIGVEERSRQTKIANPRPAVATDQYIVWLEVAMQKANLVRRRQSAAGLNEDGHDVSP
jgi:hypothetical protein